MRIKGQTLGNQESDSRLCRTNIKQCETQRIDQAVPANGNPQVTPAAHINPPEQNTESPIAQNAYGALSEVNDAENDPTNQDGDPLPNRGMID